MKFSVSLNEKESILLLDYMKENKIKSKAEAIRKCIRENVNLESKEDLLLDINNKLNRIVYRENIQKKLLEQFYANMKFFVDKDVKTEKWLQRFYEKMAFIKAKLWINFLYVNDFIFKNCYNKYIRKTECDRMLNKVQLVDLIQDEDTKLNNEFSINIKTHSITDQEASGRCWSFAGLNILREKVIEKCKLDNFELSGSYIAFYDKLERFNIYLERLINYKKNNKNLYNRYVSSLLENGLGDGGYFTQLANLIEKYGVVPKKYFS